MRDLFVVLLYIIGATYVLLMLSYLFHIFDCACREDKDIKWFGYALQATIFGCVMYSIISFGMWLQDVCHL